MSDFPTLPCFPCPHQSSCCAFGTTLSDDEAMALAARYGSDKVYRTQWGEWRTRVRGRRCVFLENNVCTIHDHPSYPEVCRGFPWVDAETGEAYQYDQTICPEFVRSPELVELTLTNRSLHDPRMPLVARACPPPDRPAHGSNRRQPRAREAAARPDHSD